MSRRRPKIEGYSIGKLLGRGSFADVYLVVDQKTGTRLACKCIDKTSVADARGHQRLNREINALKALSHPHIVNLHSIVEGKRYYGVLMEFCEGGSLSEYIATEKRLDEKIAQNVFKQIMEALSFCHDKGVAHRDLKPSNIMINTFPNVKIADFGLANLMGDEGMMSTVCGTIAFLAPEVFLGNYNGCAADVWSAGVLLYTMLVGKLPWKGTSQVQIQQEMAKGPPNIDNVSEACNDLIKAMMTVDPKKRITAPEVLRHYWYRPAVMPSPHQNLRAGARVSSTSESYDSSRHSVTPDNETRSLPKRTLIPKVKLSFDIE